MGFVREARFKKVSDQEREFWLARLGLANSARPETLFVKVRTCVSLFLCRGFSTKGLTCFDSFHPVTLFRVWTHDV